MSTLRSTVMTCVFCSVAFGCDALMLLPGNNRGDAVMVGGGTASTFVERSAGEPARFGVELALSFEGLPQTGGPYAWELPMPPETGLPFDHVVLKWHPDGHEPLFAWGASHVDVLFFVATPDELLQIEPGDCDGAPVTCEALDRARMPLPAGARVTNFIGVGLVEPYEGDHLVNIAAPEFLGEPLTTGWTYGRSDGEYAFLEAKASRGWLETIEEEDCRPIPVPAAFTRSGWYPTQLCASWEKGSYRVTLDGFQRFTTVDAF